MKRFVIAIILMAVLTVMGFLSLWHARHTRDTLSQQILHIQNHALDNRDDAMREMAKLTDMWSRRKAILVHHVRHHMMDDIGKGLSRAAVFAEEGQMTLFRA
ncbi:MAG: DUF4363 family protein, partial [Oscillospiraceae bacterium]|nr:DUF4363 family protein [Oscillospiraceae bacterium]